MTNPLTTKDIRAPPWSHNPKALASNDLCHVLSHSSETLLPVLRDNLRACFTALAFPLT
jgi:hypothetical protein